MRKNFSPLVQSVNYIANVAKLWHANLIYETNNDTPRDQTEIEIKRQQKLCCA